jgi:hypothetical protein
MLPGSHVHADRPGASLQVDLDVRLGGEPGRGAVRLGRLSLSVVDLPALQTALTPGELRGPRRGCSSSGLLGAGARVGRRPWLPVAGSHGGHALVAGTGPCEYAGRPGGGLVSEDSEAVLGARRRSSVGGLTSTVRRAPFRRAIFRRAPSGPDTGC